MFQEEKSNNINLSEGVVTNKSGEKGAGVFARREFSPGEVVVVGKALEPAGKRTHHSIQLDWDTHFYLDKPAILLNHSCDPICGVQVNEFNGYNFVALRVIEPGEEICWDYCTTEYISIAIKHCLCGSASCRKHIRGWKYLSSELKQRYSDLNIVAPYLIGH